MLINDDDGKFEVQFPTKTVTVDLFDAHESLAEAEKGMGKDDRGKWSAAVKEWAASVLGMPVTTRTAWVLRKAIIERIDAVGKATSGTPS